MGCRHCIPVRRDDNEMTTIDPLTGITEQNKCCKVIAGHGIGYYCAARRFTRNYSGIHRTWQGFSTLALPREKASPSFPDGTTMRCLEQMLMCSVLLLKNPVLGSNEKFGLLISWRPDSRKCPSPPTLQTAVIPSGTSTM